jgi:hypothetical protein
VLLAACVAGAPAVLIAAGVLLFARGSGSHPQRANRVAAPPAQVTTAAVPALPAAPRASRPSLRPPSTTAASRVRAAALRLAARLPVKLDTTALLRVGSNVYAVGGTTRDGTPSDGIWQLDPKTDRVTSIGRFIEPLTAAAAATRDGVLYLAGGWTGAQLATGVLRWSPGQSSSLVTRLPVALRDGSAAFVGGRLFVAGGSPRHVYEVDVNAGTLADASTEPRQLRAAPSNLDVLIQASRAAS